MDSVIGLVGAGLGVALIPALYARLPVPKVLYKPLRDRFAVAEIALAWRTLIHRRSCEPLSIRRGVPFQPCHRIRDQVRLINEAPR